MEPDDLECGNHCFAAGICRDSPSKFSRTSVPGSPHVNIAMQAANNIGVVYVVFFTLLQAIYPAAFVLYPAIEKARKIRALEYANGVRRGPLWIAYGLFDFLFVLAISVGVTATISTQLVWNGPIWVMLPILALYGLAAILLGYIVSHFVSGPLKSFLATAGISVLMYGIAAISFAVSLPSLCIGALVLIRIGWLRLL